ncbi:MAG TPA: helix-turn-helix transcriptional regulator [Nitrospiria bacterium]
MKKVSGAQVGQRIRAIRGKVTQTDFARLIGVRKQNYVSRYEHGRIPNPALLVRIAEYGKVTVDWMLTGRGKGPRSR